MKLTIKTENGQKVVDLKNDLQFNTLEGEQYVFSSGFSNYVLSFKDDQASVVLTFNVDGKSIKVELNGIVPHLQANTQDTANPTAIIINKGINNKDVDNLLTNADFNGGEIIDRLEAIISKPVELGDAKSSNVTLITDYQTLLESLGAAAAGGEAAAGNATSDGSSFNSIFSLTDGGLNDIAATDRWVNLSESISTIPVETADYSDTATATIIDNDIPTIVVGKPGEVGTADITVPEGTDAVFAVEVKNASANSTLTLTLADGTALTEDYFDSANAGHFTYSTDNGNTWTTVTGPITLNAGNTNILVSTDTIDDLIDEANETFTLTGTLTSNATDYSDTATATIIDNDVPTIFV